MIFLMNSAMMPDDGKYLIETIDTDTFKEAVIDADAQDNLKSMIGYPETARIIEDLTGVKIEVSRQETRLETGDMMLICRLKYRMGDPAIKGKTKQSIDDFRFSRCHFIPPHKITRRQK